MTGIRLYFGRIIAAPRGYQEKSEVDHCAFPYYSKQKIEYQKPKFEVSAIRAQLPTLRYYTMQVVKMQEKNRKKTEILFCIKVVVKMQAKTGKIPKFCPAFR